MRSVAGMMFALFLNTAVFGFAASPFRADPSALVGMNFQQFTQTYPDECKRMLELPPAEALHYLDWSEHNAVTVHRCEIKHRSKEIIPGYIDNFYKEYLYVKNGKIFCVQFEADPISLFKLFDHIKAAYGPDDDILSIKIFGSTAPTVVDRSGSGEINYSIGNETTIVNDHGASYGMSEVWTKCKFTLIVRAGSYEGFNGSGSTSTTVQFFGLNDDGSPYHSIRSLQRYACDHTQSR